MKKFVTLTLVGLLVSTFIIACGSSKNGNCDAYGQNDAKPSTDVASK